MIKCTKQWTDKERQVLQRAIEILQSRNCDFLCHAVALARKQLFGSFYAPEGKSIRTYVRELLGGEPTLGGWRMDNDPSFDWDGEDDGHGDHTAVRVEWARWMLGEVEADGSKFPVNVPVKEEANNG